MPLDTIQTASCALQARATRPLPGGAFFYGVQGTPFVDAAEAWFWTLDCLDARAERSRGCSGLKIGRPCEPDDVVNAMARLNLPPMHARTVVSWGKRRIAPPEATEARRFWDEVMDRLTVVLVIKGIVRVPAPASDRQVRDIALMDVPLTGLVPPADAGGSGDLDRALENLGRAVAEREARMVAEREARVG